ncbi:MAG: glutamate--tRNA ligase [Spirochaetaceae bacterium]|nr:MAG: glutamate--tRNA ligase [Spirochaetaceae bacterium]
MSVRVRYAPSPTGMQHIGGIRTALFNYFFARVNGGQFILRIEDTDRERFDERALQDIYDSFAWLGISWDEGPDCGGEYGPYIQSGRSDIYRLYAEQLVASGHAYWAYDTPERLEAMRQEQQKNKSKHQGYDRFFRDMSETEIEQWRSKGIPGVIRFKVPLSGETKIDDMVLGEIIRKNEDVSPDPVLLKSDGFPTYHLANVIDDHLMQISHIMRAQEWIPSAPLHVLLYEAFGWQPPQYVHLPMVMGKDGQKLSKRHGSTSLREFIAQGYLPEALINYVMLLGWSYDDKTEFFSRNELEKLFDASRISRSPSVFDYKKLDWFNGQYIRLFSDEDLVGRIIPLMQEAGIVSEPAGLADVELLSKAAPLVKERLKYLTDAPEALGFLFSAPNGLTAEDLIPKKSNPDDTLQALQFALEMLSSFEGMDETAFEQYFHDLSEKHGLKIGALMMPVRIAITGSAKSPPLFGSIDLLGTEEAIQRIQSAMTIFTN